MPWSTLALTVLASLLMGCGGGGNGASRGLDESRAPTPAVAPPTAPSLPPTVSSAPIELQTTVCSSSDFLNTTLALQNLFQDWNPIDADSYHQASDLMWELATAASAYGDSDAASAFIGLAGEWDDAAALIEQSETGNLDALMSGMEKGNAAITAVGDIYDSLDC